MSREVTRNQREWLEGEIAVWQSMGLVDAQRGRALLDIYETRDSFEARQQARGLLALLALAAVLVGLGVLLLIGYNWQGMPAPLKVGLIFIALIATHCTGFNLRFRLGWRRVSEVMFFAGCLLFGAAIWLLAQIFHIESSNYDALWWWAIGTLPFALLLDTVLLHLLFASLLAMWLGLDVLSLHRLIWGNVPSAGYSLPLLVAPALWWAYRKNSAKTVGIYVALLAWWIVLQPIAWRLQANPAYFIGAVGSIMLLVAATLVPLSFHSVNEEIDRHADTLWRGGVEQMILILMLAALTLLISYLIQRKSRNSGALAWVSQRELLHQIVVKQSKPLGLLGLFAFLAVIGTTVREPWTPTIAANLAMVAISLWLMRVGLEDDRSRPFGAGVVYLLLWAVLRYIDLFGAFGGMLGASLMFFVCGAVLLGVALYWRNRKAVSLG